MKRKWKALLTVGLSMIFFLVLALSCGERKNKVESNLGTTNNGQEISNIITITASNYEREVLNADKIVLLDFWASWCGPCMSLAPVLEEVAKERPDIIIGKVNVDEEGELAAQFGVAIIPNLFVVKDGKVVKQGSGYMSKEKLLAFLDIE